MKNKKILYLSNSVLPSREANSVHVMKMCQAFSEFYAVELVCYAGKQKFDLDRLFDDYGVTSRFSIVFLQVATFRGKFFQKIFKIYSILKNNPKNTIIYGRDAYSVYLAAKMGFKVYYESHGIPALTLYGRTERMLFRHPNFCGLIVISGKLKELYTADESYSLKSDNIIVLHDGADIPGIPKNTVELGKGFHVGYIGSLFYEGRGINVIIETAKKTPDFTFHLIGGSREQVSYWQERAPGNVIFYGYLPHSKAAEYLAAFNVVLMPYQKQLKLETMNIDTSAWMSPMKMFEYMAAQKAIISSNLPVIMEVLNDKNSVLVEPDDPEEWADALKRLHNEKEFCSSIAECAFSDCAQNYTWQKRAMKLKEEFE